MAKKFFYVCAGICLLAISYHFGAQSASAQAPGNAVVAGTIANGSIPVAITANGDSYAASYSSSVGAYTWFRTGNVFGNGPTGAVGATWGQVKATYRK